MYAHVDTIKGVEQFRQQDGVDAHEWSNDCLTVSDFNLVKMYYPCRYGLPLVGRKDPMQLYYIYELYKKSYLSSIMNSL